MIHNGVALERMRLLILNHISANLAEDFANPPEVDVSGLTSAICDDICLRVKQDVLGQGPYSYPTAKYPADWKEALKQRFAPAWFLDRWPVKWTAVVFDARVVYPKIALPDKEHYVAVNVRKLQDYEGQVIA